MNTIKLDKKNVKMIAHRGVSGLECENTAAAFVAAGNRSYFGIETDMHVTRDGRFAILHDANPERVSGVSIDVEKSDFCETDSIKLYDREAGLTRRDLVIPELCEYIRICKRYEKIAVLELKTYADVETFAKMVEEIRALDYLENIVFISFGKSAVENIRKLLPEAKIQFLDVKWHPEILPWMLENRFDLDIAQAEVTPELVKLMHDNGLEINCWTVNSKERGEELAAMRVDYITTNILE